MPANEIYPIFNALVKSANLLREKIVQKTSSGGYPSGENRVDASYVSIGQATRVGQPQATEGFYFIDVIIDIKQAPYARAYEYGSGIHGSRGETYTIAPRNAKKLVFPWSPQDPLAAIMSEKVSMSEKMRNRLIYSYMNSYDGNIDLPDPWFFNHVDHPGVRAKPYIKPSVDENEPNVLEFFGKAAVEMVQGVIGGNVTYEVRI